MTQHIALITLVVRDYDEALKFYLERLGFELIEDTTLGADKRWVVVRPPGQPGAAILLAKATGDRQSAAVGAQTGERVFLFLNTDDFGRDYAAYTQRGVIFEEEPRYEAYGVVAVFRDLYGNRWDLIQPSAVA
ncbi:MAG TPA: VOC family protein [Bradyrhizobium sp.]|jgi:catechol 2,3-dioxygenase-like lactoylglutathione lyase family enzyme